MSALLDDSTTALAPAQLLPDVGTATVVSNCPTMVAGNARVTR
ncbi:hypothetical protein [Saccharopolyspora pogona]|nr:hypothetical protein [Saccharopolyspora pogona]